MDTLQAQLQYESFGNDSDELVVFHSVVAFSQAETLPPGYVKGGSSADETIFGGAGNDTLRGGAGNDILFGLAGADMIYGDAGADILVGGRGADSLFGGVGNDVIIYVPQNQGTVVMQGGSDIDLLDASVRREDLVINLNDVYTDFEYVVTGSGNDYIIGNASANLLVGGRGSDTLFGGIGNDTLYGGRGGDCIDGGSGNGVDWLIGASGNDTYIVGTSKDNVIETDDNGIDLVQASVSYALSDNVENLTLTGTAAINAAGNSLDNVISGNSGSNLIYGNAGDDTISGSAGNDLIFGDFYIENDGFIDASGWLNDSTTDNGYYGDAGRLVTGLGNDSVYNADFGEKSMTRNDDGSTAALSLHGNEAAGVFEHGINFFGTRYDRLYINNNGNLTFTYSQSTYTPYVITDVTSNPMIAAFFADVDTRAGVTTATTGGNSKGTNMIYYDYDVSSQTFTATWDDVGYYSSHTDRLNAFQIQLVNRGGNQVINGNDTGDNFDIIFRYEDVNWTTGDMSGGLGGLGGTLARAGWISGNGDAQGYYELPQSGNQNDLLNLENLAGNTGSPGLWVFEVRNGAAPVLAQSTDGGDDYLMGGAGADTISGGFGSDTLYGDYGNDYVVGGYGKDLLDGGDGNDAIFGDEGNDIVIGGLGNDTMSGGAGNDTYQFGYGFGNDYLVVDAANDSNDIIQFIGNEKYDGLTFSKAGNDYLITVTDSNQTITLHGGAVNQLMFADGTTRVLANDIWSGLGNDTGNNSNDSNDSNDTSHQFSIQFDYTYDTKGFFADSSRRAALEAAASYWTAIIQDDFPTLTAGTTFEIRNPETGLDQSVTLSQNIDDMIVYVGSASPPFLTSSSTAWAAAMSAPTTYYSDNTRMTGNDFQPYGGVMSFNSNPGSIQAGANWFFDTTPATANDIPENYIDFITVAMHEIGHVLGISSEGTMYSRLVTNNQFTGATAAALNGGNAIPLTADGHVVSDFGLSNHVALMDPTTGTGTRDVVTQLDAALLADIGYTIAPFNDAPLATEANDRIELPYQGGVIHGLGGSDRIYGGTGNDLIYGDNGIDTLRGSDGWDTLYGGNDADQLFGEGGNDLVYGDAGDDHVEGGDGDDTLFGGADNDEIFGLMGNDLFYGDAGDDYLDGGDGSDTLYGGAGNDLLWGKSGSDIFLFSGNFGSDDVEDFIHGQDKLCVSSSYGYLTSADLLNHATTGTWGGTNPYYSFDLLNGNIFGVFADTNLTANDIIIFT